MPAGRPPSRIATAPTTNPSALPKDHRIRADGVVMVRVHIWLPLELVQAVDIQSQRRHTSRSGLINTCIQREIFK